MSPCCVLVATAFYSYPAILGGVCTEGQGSAFLVDADAIFNLLANRSPNKFSLASTNG